MLSVFATLASISIAIAPPAEIRASFIALDRAFTVAADCLWRNPGPDLERAYAGSERRLGKFRMEAQEIWGGEAAPAANPPPVGERRCDSEDAPDALARAEAALDEHARVFRQATAGIEQGAWVGPLKLCRDTATSVTHEVDRVSGRDILTVTLSGEAAPLLTAITRRSVNLMLAVRLDGVVVAAPRIPEVITGGAFIVSGPGKPILEDMRVRIADSC